jgi:predicted aldo/keto reductase-like oxidoreductase
VAGCTGCREQCPYGIDVCEINRCLNYADGYGDRDLARDNYFALPPEKTLAACGNCTECTVRCVNGLDIRERIGRARRLFT